MDQKYSGDKTGKLEDKTQSVKHSAPGNEAAQTVPEERTPWSHDFHHYASLVNVAGNLKTFGWIIFSLTFVIGLAFIFTGMGQEPYHQKVMGLSAGLLFLLVGTVIKIVWNVVAEMINLFIDVANDLHALKMK